MLKTMMEYWNQQKLNCLLQVIPTKFNSWYLIRKYEDQEK